MTATTTNPWTLSGRLAWEDRAEDAGRLAPDDRLTCHVHGRWIHECVASPLHVSQVTRHRWCCGCSAELTVAIDQLGRSVTMACPRCGDGHSPTTERLITACQASLTLAHTRQRQLVAA